MAEGYWELFWKTGLPEAWLIWRAEGKPDAAAASAEETEGGTLV